MTSLGRTVASIRMIAAKDLRIEWRSRVIAFQVLPFAVVVLVIFAFALDTKAVRFVDAPNGSSRAVGLLPLVAPGLMWLAALFSLMLMVQRSFAVEADDGAIDALRLAGISPSNLYWGKTLALAAELLVIAAVTMPIGLVLYQVTVPAAAWPVLVVVVCLANGAFAAVGTLYGAFTMRAEGAVLLPLLVFPATAPIVVAATRATESAFGTDGAAVADGWPWIGLLGVYAVVLGVSGSVAFGPLTSELQ